ncbi:fungal specific transcription factor [Colletotrichum truncatum]|uniref:Fungal specific transcription factor n=1 Tax=Colletotrichum truncatum TaxID=5467 RepID=A0ACC3Z6G8_COLTU
MSQAMFGRLADMERQVEQLQKSQGSGIPSGTTTVEQTSQTDAVTQLNPPTNSGRETANESSVHAVGACSLLSPEGAKKVDYIIGDSRFSNLIQGVLRQIRQRPGRPTLQVFDAVEHHFPPNNIAMDLVDDFLASQNHALGVFRAAEVREVLQQHIYGEPTTRVGASMCLNVIVAHSIRKRDKMQVAWDYEKYIFNALRYLPSALIEQPDPLTIGSLISLVRYFIFTGDNHIAVSLLGLTVQLVLLAGYHLKDNLSDLNAADMLHRRRLFWHAYIIDRDLMLRIGKPPIISEEFLVDLPDAQPLDGYSIFYYPGNVHVNYFRQQAELAEIQGRIWRRIYSRVDNESFSRSQLEAEIISLDTELQSWRKKLPDITQSIAEAVPSSSAGNKMKILTVLHFAYFQTVVAVGFTGGETGGETEFRSSITNNSKLVLIDGS